MTELQLHRFDRELIDSIADENHYFSMSEFSTGVVGLRPATCDTASCMAGHIQALRPERAAALFKEILGIPLGVASIHTKVARVIYREETGKPCLLDFYGDRHPRPLGQQSRQEAIDHIKGIHSEWPQLEIAEPVT